MPSQEPSRLGPAPYHREAERRQMTVLFCDLVGSTVLASSLDPEDLRELIRNYQVAATALIERRAGFVARYIGDGILVYFGYPYAREDDTVRAVSAGLELAAVVQELPTLPGIDLKVRIGIATGTVVVGDIVEKGTFLEGAAVAGLPVHLAARLEALAEAGTVVISADTRKLIGDQFDVLALGSHQLKGFENPVAAWKVLGERSLESRLRPRSRSAALTPLIGRDQQMLELRQCWSRAIEGAGQVVTIRGEPGIGKSRLVYAFREHAIERPEMLLHLCCSPHFENTELFPVIDLLQRLAKFERQDTPDVKAAKLEKLLSSVDYEAYAAGALPYLVELFSILPSSRDGLLSETPERRKQRLLDILALMITRLVEREPTIILIEDVHWIDATTLVLLQQLLTKVPTLPVLVLLTTRPQFELPWREPGFAKVLDLERLDKPNSRRVVEAVAKDMTLGPQLLEQILDKSDGVPLFLEEITKAVLDSGDGRTRSERCLPGEVARSWTVPSTLQDSLMSRLDRLGIAKEVAQIGAAIGRNFSFEMLARVAEISAHELRDALDRLMEADLLNCQGSGSEMTCAFRHALIRDAAYGALLRAKRRTLHGRIAEAMQNRVGGADVEPELLAYHLTEANLPSRAIPYWYNAATRAAARAAYVESTGHVTTALNLLTGVPDEDDRFRLELGLQIQLGLSLSASRGYAVSEVQNAYARARELCRWFGNSAQQFPVLRGLATFYIVRDELVTARDLAQQCARIGEATQRSEYLIEGYTALGYVLVFMGEFSQGRILLKRAVEHYRRDGGERLEYQTPQDPLVACLSLLAIVSWAQGDFADASEYNREALAAAQRLNRPFDIAYANCFAAMFENVRGERFAARRLAETTVQISRDHRFDVWLLAASMHLAIAEGAIQPSADAINSLLSMLSAWKLGGAELNRPFFLAGLAEIYCGKGDIPEGLAVVQEGIEHANRTEEHLYTAVLHRIRAELLQAAGDTPGARSALQTALEIARQQKAKGYEFEILQTAMRIGMPEQDGAPLAANDGVAEGKSSPSLTQPLSR